jgi:hypothetical protein
VATINGKELPPEDCGWWVDTTFRKRSLNGLLQTGVNKIVLTGIADPKIEIESIYVIGDFAVNTEDMRSFIIATEDTRTLGGDLVVQGYPFFAGTLSLTKTFDIGLNEESAAKLVFDSPQFIVGDVWVNGENAGQAIWNPYEVEIGSFLRDGENTVRVDIVHSLRNLLGPHHHRNGELRGVGPDSFSDARNWTDVYQFVPFGFASVRIVVGA